MDKTKKCDSKESYKSDVTKLLVKFPNFSATLNIAICLLFMILILSCGSDKKKNKDWLESNNLIKEFFDKHFDFYRSFEKKISYDESKQYIEDCKLLLLKYPKSNNDAKLFISEIIIISHDLLQATEILNRMKKLIPGNIYKEIIDAFISGLTVDVIELYEIFTGNTPKEKEMRKLYKEYQFLVDTYFSNIETHLENSKKLFDKYDIK